jgi:hypothetical protein
LQPLHAALEADLAAFDDQERPLLAQRMPAKTIAAALDEHFHAVKNCLVGIEPVSNFILVECYRDRRDADTWKEAILEETKGMKVEIVLLTSDLARGLLCCAEKGLGVAHSPDLFHGQRDLLKPLMLPLARPIQQAEKDMEKAKKHVERLDVPAGQAQPPEEFEALVEAVRREVALGDQVEELKGRRFSAKVADQAFAGRPKRSRTRRRKWRKLSMPKARHRMARRPWLKPSVRPLLERLTK